MHFSFSCLCMPMFIYYLNAYESCTAVSTDPSSGTNGRKTKNVAIPERKKNYVNIFVVCRYWKTRCRRNVYNKWWE